MSPNIFLSYRVSDEPGFVGRLYDRLKSAFPDAQIFMDVEGIAAGRDFGQVIQQAIHNSDVVLALIGHRWLTADTSNGRRRIDNDDDWVRREIAEGLKTKNRVIPIFINGQAPLKACDLPPSIGSLADLQALELTHKHFDANAEKITEEVRRRLNEIAAAKNAPKDWDQASFFEATEGKRAYLEPRYLKIISWAKSRHTLRWGTGAKVASFLVLSKGSGRTVISCEANGTSYVYLKALEDMGALTNLATREAFVDQLNSVQGLSIIKEKAKSASVGFQIRHVEVTDVDKLLDVLDRALTSSEMI